MACCGGCCLSTGWCSLVLDWRSKRRDRGCSSRAVRRPCVPFRDRACRFVHVNFRKTQRGGRSSGERTRKDEDVCWTLEFAPFLCFLKSFRRRRPAAELFLASVYIGISSVRSRAISRLLQSISRNFPREYDVTALTPVSRRRAARE